MPHRVEPSYAPMSTTQPQPAYPYAPPPAPASKARRSPYDRRASPPPIATLPTHSGSPSPSAASSLNDRSAVSTPPVGASVSAPAPRRSPPPQHHQPYEMPRGYAGGYMYAPPPPPPAHAQTHPHPGYAPHPHDERYAHAAHAPQYAPQPFPITHGTYVPYPLPGTILSQPMAPPPGGGAGAIQVIHTDDAATKLSDRVRRRCFNCCTTDTSTWRRSNLSPGKVLCNKCGLFERTHSRPRPEQFPHKRGPLASSTLRSRTPPQAQPTYQNPPGPSASSASAPNGASSHPGTPKPPAQAAPALNGAQNSSRSASRDGRREEASAKEDAGRRGGSPE
ncbi:hypothetical protein MSAN_00469600 [Mycena sanguinolenta]|uniref:GATA-type domain-containing protein n=1 Tax=Mycena sanguinolenta TaxID=230812 RepID=A0A8H6ZEE3_9AGAR|nr:hypothetical protein MSAN_00469600 [Mycena sanguinolenta]